MNLPQKYSVSEPGIRWKVCNGVRYIEVVLKGLDDPGIMDVVLDFKKLLKSESPGTVRILSDLNGFISHSNINPAVREFAKEFQVYSYKSAVIGVSPRRISLYKIFLKVIKSKAVIFKTKEEALRHILS